MRSYLEAMHASPYGAPEPAEKPLTILAALRPRMLALSASHADGAHPYNVTPEHTHQAREILGPGKLLYPEVWVLLETDPAKARALGREALANYLRLENYLNNWRWLGYSEDDLAGGGSDWLIDENVAWGDEGKIRARLQQHWDAGADHICIQAISPDGGRKPDEKVLALLAPGG
jgi:probable F420-dependent oxidoreductase